MLFLAIIVALLLACTPYAGADILTNDGREFRFIINDASRFTPEQLLMMRDIARDQLDSNERLTLKEIEASAEIRKAEEDTKLANRVVWAAFLFVGIICAAAIAFSRKK